MVVKRAVESIWIEIQKFLPNFIDALVYLAIAIVTLVGVMKCLIPLWRSSRALHRGVARLEHAAGTDRPVWQEARFLGKRLQLPWQKFLRNAEQLDLRGLPCDVDDYINEDSVIYGPGHAQLADLIPGLLTSLGILGTFMGLMRGLSGIDFTDANKLIAGIPTLLEGMRFAFATSVAGISCSLAFNMLNRIAVGSGFKALDDFSDAFSQLAMQPPLDEGVQVICQNQDRNVMIRSTAEELSVRMAGAMEMAIGRAMHPVTMSMDNFIMGATREQIDGVQKLVNQFILKMNESLQGQFLQLGKTLTEVNQSQSLSYEKLDQSLAAAQTIVDDVQEMHRASQQVMERFEHYVKELKEARQADTRFESKTADLLENMHKASEQQALYLNKLQAYQAALQGSLTEYTKWSDEILSGVRMQGEENARQSAAASEELQKSSQMLAGSYASFVENITEGLARALGMFDENMHGMLDTLGEKLEQLSALVNSVPSRLEESSEEYGSQVKLYIDSLSSLQRAMTDISASLARSRENAKPMKEGKEEAAK